MLALAEDAYPAPAPVPRNIPDDILAALVADEVVDLTGDETFVFRGLDAERRSRIEDVSRGYRGGKARATTGHRDDRGRWIPDAGPDAGHSNGNAGPRTLDVPLVGVAGAPTLVSSVTSQTRRDETSTGGVTSSHTPRTESESETARATSTPPGVARAQSEVGGGRYGTPDVPTCRDPKAHGSDWRYIVGVGWKCLVCDGERPDEPSFREKARDAGATL